MSFLKDRYPRLPARPLYPLLLVSSVAYAALTRIRNRLYDRSLLHIHRAEARVVSIGNITVGGTGKTPLVHRTAEEALRRGLRPAVLSRGYKARDAAGEGLNDEGAMLRAVLPGAKILQDPDRVRAARRAVEKEDADFLVLDDGFQHRRLYRDVDVVLVDAGRPFGFGRVLPAGLLREPVEGLNRARVVVVTRSDQVSEDTLLDLEDVLARLAPKTLLFRALFRPDRLRPLGGGPEEGVEVLSKRKVYPFCGLANPRAFEDTLEGLGARISGRTRFPDHHAYTREDLDQVLDAARGVGAEVVVTTAKDAVKLQGLEAAAGVRVLEGTFRFQEGEDRFWNLIFEGRRAPHRS